LLTDHDDVWQRIRAGFRIDDTATANPLVGDHAAWFAARPDNVRRLAVARTALPLITSSRNSTAARCRWKSRCCR
jgi:hypothetical protein